MKRFASLFQAIDRTTSTNAKVEAMASYFTSAPREDASWALYFLCGNKVKKLVASGNLSRWAREVAGVPEWLFGESYSVVGDLAETIALLVSNENTAASRAPNSQLENLPLHRWMLEHILPLRGASESEQKQAVTSWWRKLSTLEVFLVNKILTGSLRVGISQTLVERALAEVAGIDKAVISHRLSGSWNPTPELLESLLSNDPGSQNTDSRPYPFFLASPVDDAGGIESLGPITDFQIEWKFDGIRAQLVRRGASTFLWSRGQELITDRYPELVDSAARLPGGTVLDGEILAMRDGVPLPFAVLQRRIGRLKPTGKMIAAAPVGFVAYDVLESGGHDIRTLPLTDRRRILELVIAQVNSPRFTLSELILANSWDVLTELRKESRQRGVEGLMLKRKVSPYQSGRVRADWWKWKVDPYTIDAVLVYAQPGHGRRANLLTDYTFAVWNQGVLSVFAKAYSGLNQDEIDKIDRWIRQNTLERFGPVRVLKPEQVFELGFEAIAKSARHKSGFAVRFPRILRWRTDKPAIEADTLQTIDAMLQSAGGGAPDISEDFKKVSKPKSATRTSDPTLFDQLE